MTDAASIFAIVYAALMLFASAAIETPNKNRAILLSGLNLLAVVYVYMMVRT